MPTRRAIFMFFFTLFLLLGAWISKLVWVYLAFSVSSGLIILSFLLSRLLFLNIEITRQIPPQAYEDDIVNVSIKIRNRIALLDQSIEVTDEFSAGAPQRQQKTIFFNGLPQGKSEFSYQEYCYKRGCYRIGPFRVKIFEPLGLFYFQKNLPVYSTLIVYPRIFHVQQLPFILGRLAPRFGEQTTRISGDYEEFYGIREYTQADGWRRIHWRSSARLGELMVRHFEQSSQWKALLILDAAKSNNAGYGKDTTFEYGVKIAASLANHLLMKSASFGIITSAAVPFYSGIKKGKKHFYRILEKLAVISPNGDIPLPEIIARHQWVIPQSSSLIIITNNFDQTLVRLLRYLKLRKNSGIIPIILNTPTFISDAKTKKTAKKQVSLKGVFSELSLNVYFIDCKDDLKQHFMK